MTALPTPAPYATRIVDDAMPGFAELQARVLAPGFPWYYARATRETDGAANPYLAGWVHLVYDHGKWYSQDAQFITGKIIEAFQAIEEPAETVFRIRIVLNAVSDQPYLNGPHVDFVWPHKTALLYLNDADGDTVIYEERWREGYGGPYTVAQAIAPKAGRMALFEGLRFHTGTTPTKTARRVVLNVNYE
jgi:hypothetical protein